MLVTNSLAPFSLPSSETIKCHKGINNKLCQPILSNIKSCPKISIVTPSFNSAKYIKETIQSVISQSGNFTIEYFVIDNCSTDHTKIIVEEFQILLNDGHFPLGCHGIDFYFISENDNGMYDAINKGFEKATGDIFAWLNADDIYLPGALATITEVFQTYQDVHWVKGITSYITESSSIWQAGKPLLYTQDWVEAGIYGRDHYFIQQDSVFWRAWLWKKCGSMDTHYKRAGDYCLWIRFAQYSKLVSIRAWVSCFRKVEGQISQDHLEYMKEVRSFSPGKVILSRKVRLFLLYEKWLPQVIRPTIFRLLFGKLQFLIVTIGSDNELKKVEGEYYDIVRQISCEN